MSLKEYQQCTLKSLSNFLTACVLVYGRDMTSQHSFIIST